MKSRVIPKTGRKIKDEGHRAALLAEMEQVAENFAKRRKEKLEQLQSFADVCTFFDASSSYIS